MARVLHRKLGLISKISSLQTANAEGYSGEISYPEPSISLQQLKRLKPSEVEEAIIDYLAGASVQAVADRLGVSRQTLSKILNDRHVQRRRGALNADQISQLAAARERGLTLQQIADLLGVSLSTVKRCTRQHRR